MHTRLPSRFVFRSPLTACLAVLLVAIVSTARAQAKPDRLIDQPAFDILTLDKANDNKVLKIYPLPLPGRRVPEKPKASDTLRIKLLDTSEEFDVAWLHVAKLQLFEELVMAEASKLASEGNFDEAYEYLTFLSNYYPTTPGLAEARQNFLYLSAGAAFKQKQYEEALAVLEELLTLNPQYRASESAPPLLQVLGSILEPLLAECMERQDFRTIRTLLTRVAKQHKAANEPFVQAWQERLKNLASQKQASAQEHLAAGRYMEAYEAVSAMDNVWPGLPGGAELHAEISRRYPLVRVGVQSPALQFDSRSLTNVAARRAGRLTERLLVELTGLGPEGGQYRSPFGTLRRSDDGLSLSFNINGATEGLAAIDLAQQLLEKAQPSSPTYSANWARIVSEVRRTSPQEIEVLFRAPHVLPESLLRAPFALAAAGNPSASPYHPYTIFSREPALLRFTVSPTYAFNRPGQPAEIIERFYDDPERARSALTRGEIDLLDQIFPGDIPALKANPNLVVTPLDAPTTHVLVVRSPNPFLANSTFRRALLYGSNRTLLLQQGLLRGQTIPGCRVVSAPFPAPASSTASTAYGYDPAIEPRAYDPRLALTLRLLADKDVQATRPKTADAPPLTPKLTLGHPADDVSRIACRGLARQWKVIGVECSLSEFAPGVFDDAENKCDLVYLQLAAWEPVVDAGRLLGPGGPAFSPSPVLQQTLRQIESARNWREARQRLFQLHRLLHEDVTLLPLWQLTDHFAHTRALQGITPSPMRLYQDVEQWRTTTEVAEARR